jgi:hypothetical protein
MKIESNETKFVAERRKKKIQCEKQINRERPNGIRISSFVYAVILENVRCHLSLDI